MLGGEEMWGKVKAESLAWGLGSIIDIQVRYEQVVSNAGVRTGQSFMYFNSKDRVLW